MIHSASREVLRQADQVGVLIRHQPDPQPTHDWAKMMAASAAYRDRPDDHQFVQELRIRKLGHRGRLHVSAAEHLLQIHLRDPLCGILRVVIALRIDHQALQHPLHLARHLLQQQIKLSWPQERRDIIVRIEPPSRAQNPRSDPRRDRQRHVVVTRRSMIRHDVSRLALLIPNTAPSRYAVCQPMTTPS